MQITIPHKFSPRKYQVPILTALDNGYKRVVAIWHRRAGKDKTLINLVAKKALERVGAYYYFFPTYAQGKKILWNGRDKDGFKFTDHIPQEIRKRTDNTEMLIELRNGSIIQVIGTDKIDSIVGTNPVGCVFSEYSLQNPQAWNFIRPILAENGGWAVFNYTPRGDNHGKELYELASNDPSWYCELLTVDDTGAIDPDVLEQERREIIQETGDDALFLQEYYCSFDVPVQGAYYSKQIRELQEAGQITSVPYEKTLPVYTFWDLGVGDAMAIWFAQFVGNEIRLIDYYESSGEGLDFYKKVLDEKGYAYERPTAPHDIRVRELSSGRSRLEIAQSLGLNFDIAPNLPIDDGINAARMLLNRCWFDEEKCKQGLNALKNYRKEYDETTKKYKDRPYHDWSSNGADAFRYLAVSRDKRVTEQEDFNIYQSTYS